MITKTHTFESTREAYDACMSDENIPTGSVIVIASEEVVGVCAAWPIAVTESHGTLHAVNPGVSAETLTADGFGSLSVEHIRQAQKIARILGYKLNPTL